MSNEKSNIPDMDWGYEDPSDSSCGRPCTQDGCHECHPTGTFVLVGPEFDDDLHDRFLNENEARLASSAPKLAASVMELLELVPYLKESFSRDVAQARSERARAALQMAGIL